MAVPQSQPAAPAAPAEVIEEKEGGSGIVAAVQDEVPAAENVEQKQVEQDNQAQD